jgi:hypothetical protein
MLPFIVVLEGGSIREKRYTLAREDELLHTLVTFDDGDLFEGFLASGLNPPARARRGSITHKA